MPGLKLYTGNSLDELADVMASVYSSGTDPFKQEIILVQSQVMKKWLSLEIAKRAGISANCSFQFPNAAIQRILAVILPDLAEERYFEKENIAWRFMRIIPGLLNEPAFDELSHYIEGNDRDLKLYQLSWKLADLYDQYLTFRPEMIREWDDGTDDNWQAVLWRSLASELTGKHPPAIELDFRKAISDPENNLKSVLPERISVFGISYLPPFHMDIIFALSSIIEVNFFVLNPSEHFWADLKSHREIASIRKRTHAENPEDLHLEVGNTLLSAMGRSGRYFQNHILSQELETFDYFSEPGRDSLLHMIQSDIYSVMESGENDDKVLISQGDDSVMIHSCHSPMREVEVLYDNLRDFLEKDHSLDPSDIIVMTPDIETYAPYIQAVFSTGSKREEIPYIIADRKIRNGSRAIEAFFRLLQINETRFTADSVLDLLEYEQIKNRYDFTDMDLESIRKKVNDTNIRWSPDSEFKKTLGLPETPGNTWLHGIDRILLGYALPGNGENFFAGLLPYDLTEGEDAAVFGRFVDFFYKLRDFALLSEKRMNLHEWCLVLGRLTDDFFETDTDTEYDVMLIRNSMEVLEGIYSKGIFTEEVSLEIIVSFFEHSLGDIEIPRNQFLNGSVTFCEMLPMRSIPFRVIYLLGMNSQVFPRKYISPDFDLMKKNPEPGDRSLRDEDRYLFLETMICAKEKFIISYNGQSIVDNSVLPPSVVVSEVLDYIDDNFTCDGCNPSDSITVTHPLQAFSRKYFGGDSKLFTYSHRNYSACMAQAEEKKAQSEFLPESLSPFEEDHIALADLLAAFKNPARYLVNRRLMITLPNRETALEDSEPFVPDGLERYVLNNTVLEKMQNSMGDEDISRIVSELGIIPHASPGRFAVKSSINQIRPFNETLNKIGVRTEPGFAEIDFDINKIRLTGRIRLTNNARFIHYRYGNAKAWDRLYTWINHLVLMCAGPENYTESLCICRDKIYRYGRIPRPEKPLSELIELFIKMNSEKTFFSANTSFAFAQELAKTSDDTKAEKKAWSEWEGSSYNDIPGEKDDPYMSLLYAGEKFARGNSFRTSALAVFNPMLEAEMEGSDGE